MIGDLVEDKPHADFGPLYIHGAIGILRGDIRTITNPRKIVEYAYRVVHTQESVWVLDLRLDCLELCDIRSFGELLESLGRETKGLKV